MSRITSLLIVTSLVGVADAHADVRGVVRFGMMPLELEASRDTPFFGDDVSDAVDGYNRAADAYDRRYGGSTARIDAADLGVNETLLLFAPGFEAGGDTMYFRLEGILGVGDELRSYGIGIYPLNLQAKLSRDLSAYVSAGGTASWLDRDGSDIGGLLSARVAGGVRFSERIVVEAGYGAFMIGGVVDNDVYTDYMPSPDAPPPSPREVVAAGEGTGVVDLSVGVIF